MDKIIYIDFDGVLVDTPRLINEEIRVSGNSDDVCKNFPWKYFLQNCNEIEDNFSYIMKIAKKYKVKILTHVYSDKEQHEKERYILNKLHGIANWLLVMPTCF